MQYSGNVLSLGHRCQEIYPSCTILQRLEDEMAKVTRNKLSQQKYFPAMWVGRVSPSHSIPVCFACVVVVVVDELTVFRNRQICI
jgi:hypothetical protein